MVDAEVPYCMRRAVQRELNYADNFRINRRIDSKILQASRDVEGLCHRKFYPVTDTRSFDLPETDSLWLYQHELTSVEAIVSGDTAMSAADYILRPESGPPYTWIDVDYSGQTGWQAGNTWQRSIAITGDFGYPVTTSNPTVLASSLSALAGTLTVDSSADVGAGALILIGDERMIVTDEELITTTATITADITANKADIVISVSDGSLLDQGELLAIGGERMFVESISGNTVTVSRSQNGSTLAAHTNGATIYAPRRLEVARGQCGTDAGEHDADDTVTLLSPPSLISEYVLGLTCAALEHGSSGFARSAGSGESQRQSDDRGLSALADSVYARYGRKARSRAVC